MRRPTSLVRLLAPAVLALAAACASSGSRWEEVDDPAFVARDGAFSLELPRGWLRDGQVLVHDPEGPEIITFNAGPVLDGDAAAVDASAPELMIAMREELEALPWVEVLDCRPVTLDGLPGFRIHYRQVWDPEGEAAPPHEQLIYAAIEGDTMYAFSLEAPADAGLAAHMSDFETMVASFRRR